MVRTQIQLPTDLYNRAKRVADSREISLAELVRRGLETILSQYPEARSSQVWALPVARVGSVRVPLEELRRYAIDDETDRPIIAEQPDE